ncbi:hypothetical protein A5885_003598, partial [Enterococcus sp. 8E11_MSG4843]
GLNQENTNINLLPHYFVRMFMSPFFEADIDLLR